MDPAIRNKLISAATQFDIRAEARVMETDQELIGRYQRAYDAYQRAHRRVDRCSKPSSRTRAALQAGSFNFTRLSLETELRDRGLNPADYRGS